jgi:hypothetical protein
VCTSLSGTSPASRFSQENRRACRPRPGFENWRTLVWGSTQVRALGAEFFPQLATQDLLLVEPAQVTQFQAECALLRKNLQAIAAGVDLSTQEGVVIVRETHVERGVPVERGRVIYPNASAEIFRDMVSQRLANIEGAVRRAQHIGGGVVIW